ncbi:MAG: DNA recombination protein RmuC [Lysobacteraceae bacterium]
MNQSDFLTPAALLCIAAALGFAVLALGLWLVRARLARSAFEQGRQSAAPAIVALERDLAASQAQAQELFARLERADLELARLRERADVLSDERAVLSARAQRTEELERQAQQLSTQLRAASEAGTNAQTRAADLAARLEEQQRAAQARLREFDERLKAELAQLAHGVLEEKVRHFDERSEKQIGGLLAPLREQLAGFNQLVQNTNAEILSLKSLNQRITTEAANLTRALKGDSRAQGAWGEVVLERLLEMSGLQAGRGFQLQVVFKDEDGGRPRPDAIVRLPDEKDLVIDSKVSLIAWERAVSSGDDTGREAAMREHIGSLRRHIEALGKRDYASVPGLRTLDFVLMFVPVEAAFIEALRQDEELYGHALSRNIALVSPSTLLATLRTVAHLWRMEDRNLNAREIARQAGALHDQFAMLEEEFAKVGEQIEKALRSHESAARRIGAGRGNLMGRIDKLRKLGADARKVLPKERFEADEGEGDAETDGPLA